MQRREFSMQLGVAGFGWLTASAALAQAAPVDGQQFKSLPKEQKPTLPKPQHKVEVIEFFWYGCGHCFAFEPSLEAWAAQLPPDVYFHRIPYALLGPAEHQKTFYALEELGLLEALHRKIFNAIHVQQKRLNSEAEMLAFLSVNGVDGTKFSEALKSFSVNSKLTRGRQLAAQYQVDSVPLLAVQGRATTSPALAGTPDRALAVANYLIQRARQGG